MEELNDIFNFVLALFVGLNILYKKWQLKANSLTTIPLALNCTETYYKSDFP